MHPTNMHIHIQTVEPSESIHLSIPSIPSINLLRPESSNRRNKNKKRKAISVKAGEKKKRHETTFPRCHFPQFQSYRPVYPRPFHPMLAFSYPYPYPCDPPICGPIVHVNSPVHNSITSRGPSAKLNFKTTPHPGGGKD